MSSPTEQIVAKEQPSPLTAEEFFETVPPGVEKHVTGISTISHGPTVSNLTWKVSDLRLYCKSEGCMGYRAFQSSSDYHIAKVGHTNLYLAYTCRNCNNEGKIFAVRAQLVESRQLNLYKYGEFPQFGPPNPTKVMALMGGERGNYSKGRQCENQGLGIAAFAYYRRVVENQKTKIIGEILKVAEKLSGDPELIAELKAAKLESQFSKAIGLVKHGLPSVLLINGHNPLIILHTALSQGLHTNTDEDCLALATTIRMVLAELVERMATALKDDEALTSAVQHLLKANAKR